MGIELLNSVMTYQAQPMQKKQDDKLAVSEESKDIVTKDAALKMDNTTMIVKKNDNKEDSQDTYSEQNQQKHNERVKKAVEQMNEKLQDSEAIFGIHEKTNRLTIKIVDKETKETIRELPAEKTLDMIAKVWEMAGLLVDEKR